jgi:hypothetical protein
MGINGSHVLEALENGNLILSDGPLVFLGIDLNADNNADLVPGQDSLLHASAYAQARLIVRAMSNPDFGYPDTITLAVGTEHGKYVKKIPVPPAYDHTMRFSLDSMLAAFMSPDTLLPGEYCFLRAELTAIKDYGALQQVYRRAQQQFNSFTNPIWTGRESLIVRAEGLSAGNTYRVFPNPAGDRIYIQGGHAIPEQTYLTISDLHGKVVHAASFIAEQSNTIMVELPPVAPGMYILRFQNSAKTAVQKLLIR